MRQRIVRVLDLLWPLCAPLLAEFIIHQFM
jgi:hypothetical protein